MVALIALTELLPLYSFFQKTTKEKEPGHAKLSFAGNLDGSFGDCVVNETNIKVLLSCFFSNIIFVCIEQVPIQSFECYPSLVLALSSSAVLNDLFLIFFFSQSATCSSELKLRKLHSSKTN